MKSKFLLLLLLIFSVSCQNQTQITVKHWLGKNMTLDVNPDMIAVGIQPIKLEAGFYVLSYVDSLGCVSCKMGLPKWKAFSAYIDSVSQEHIPIVFVVQESVRRNVLYSMKADNYFPDYVIVDKKDRFRNEYNFPVEHDMQTFLLDKTDRVVAIGNPINQEKVLSLFVGYVTKKRIFEKAS